MSDPPAVPVSSAPSYAPDFIHELFWEQIRRLFADELTRSQAKMGTVGGVTDTALLVLPDGSAVQRRIPHVAGRRFSVGDRVVIAPVQGKPVIVGGVLTRMGAGEAVVDFVDLTPPLQDLLNLHTKTLGDHTTTLGDHEARIVTAQTRADDAWDRADTAQVRADDAWNKADAAQVRADDAWNKADNARSRADDAWDRAGTADFHAQAADKHAQNVYDVIVGMTQTAGTTLGNAVAQGQGAASHLAEDIDLRMNAVCRVVCGNPKCRYTGLNDPACNSGL